MTTRHPPREEQRSQDFLVYAVGRPLMLVFWTLILWGTLYGAALVYRAALAGPSVAVRQALSGGNAALALVNVGLSVGAAAVWTAVGVALWQRRRRISRGSR
jgi:hypothetical protein